VFKEVPVIILRFESNLKFHDRFSKRSRIQILLKIRPLEAALFHADGQTDRHDEANSRFQEFCESAKNEATACAT
jgi:hypothetical protein